MLMIMKGSDSHKLVELRSKTDRQLLALIGHQLESGMKMVRQAGNGDRARAERAWSDAGALLPLVHAAAPERHRLECQFDLLGRMLQKFPPAELRAHAACSHMPA
jgi:hypothetical protein